jgi:NADH-quinone oxidoreductase subunit F
VSSYPWAAGYIDDGDRPKIVTSRFQYEDSYTLERYHATGGYEGLRSAGSHARPRCTTRCEGATVLGRGGAGFPAGTKWGLMPAGKYPRYLVVNGDESEPGTYKDRLLMERDPHQLIEGCLIAAYAAGLSQVFLYIRGEMPLAHERVATALNEAYAAGYIGKNILGTNFSVDIVLHWGAGAYVVGEETALIESLEGKRGEPRLKPPFFPAAIGLYGQPTIVNNVETLSNLPWLLVNGVEAYTAIGTATSPGTRMVACQRPREAARRVRDRQRHHHVPRPALRRRVLPGHPRRQRAEGVRARRRFGPVVHARPARRAVRGSLGRRRRLDARLGRDHGDGPHHRHPEGRRSRSPTSTRPRAAASARRAVKAAPGWSVVLQRVVDGAAPDADLDQMLEIGESICPGNFPHASSERLGLTATPFPYKMTTICFVGPSAYAPVHSALTLFRDEFEAKIVERKQIPVTAALMTDTQLMSGTRDPTDEADEDAARRPERGQHHHQRRPHVARKGQLVIEAAADAGEYIPRFCYHERMTSVGKCRMCLVECDSAAARPSPCRAWCPSRPT